MSQDQIVQITELAIPAEPGGDGWDDLVGYAQYEQPTAVGWRRPPGSGTCRPTTRPPGPLDRLTAGLRPAPAYDLVSWDGDTLREAGRPVRVAADGDEHRGSRARQRGLVAFTVLNLDSDPDKVVGQGAGKVTTLDGPFVEAKEVVGGFAVISAASHAEAVAAARVVIDVHVDHWPGWEGSVQIRPITEPTENLPPG